MKKYCPKCETEKEETEFGRSQKYGLTSYCKSCKSAAKRTARNNKVGYYHDEGRINRRSKTRRLKQTVLEGYCKDGVKCVRCGFTDVRALTIDHINGDGAEQRRKNKLRPEAFNKWIIKNNFPKDLQVLCMNCQFIKRHENNEFSHIKRMG